MNIQPAFRQYTSTELKRLHRAWRKQEPPRLALLFESLSGPFNVGAILRTAAAYRVEKVFCAAMQFDLDSTNVGKTALGSQRYLRSDSFEDFDSAADAALEDGYELVALELASGAVPIHEIDFSEAVCLVIGHEDRGLSKNALSRCDHAAFLPQLGKIGSLNVATATSIAIYQARSQNWQK